MLILRHDSAFPDHPLSGPDSRISRYCPFSWWFRCDYIETRRMGAKTVKEQCDRHWRLWCERGEHVRLEQAIAQLRLEGWQLLPDGGGWRCSMHRLTPPMEG